MNGKRLTSEQLRSLTHNQMIRFFKSDFAHLSHEDQQWFSDQKAEARGRFMDEDAFNADEEAA
jgi:hypothetical protein